MKFISIFSMLFGVGLVLMTTRIEQRGITSSRIYIRRLVVLYILGTIHAYGIWFGDILRCYAICGVILFFLRNRSPKVLLTLSLILYIAFIGLACKHGWQTYQLSGEELNNVVNEWQPSLENMQGLLDAYRGSYVGQLIYRIPISHWIHVDYFIYEGEILYITCMMLLGMALFKMGFFNNQWANNSYRRIILFGLFVGIPLVLVDILFSTWFHWDKQIHDLICKPLNILGTPFISFMYVCSVIVIVKKRLLQWITPFFASAGQMALTNYLMQSILSTLFFYGHGFGWYGYLDRSQQFLFVISIWIIQLAYSYYWMKRFRFGPFEWLWRTLTYWKIQPICR